MKQSITLRQYRSLSEKGKERYREYTNEHSWISLTGLFTIGGMIEFLGQDWYKYVVRNVSHGKMTKKDWERMRCYVLPGAWINVPSNENLCDLLWKKVKSVLEQK